MSKKWIEVWVISAICLIFSIVIFPRDASTSGSLAAAAILLPAFTWWGENQ